MLLFIDWKVNISDVKDMESCPGKGVWTEIWHWTVLLRLPTIVISKITVKLLQKNPNLSSKIPISNTPTLLVTRRNRGRLWSRSWQQNRASLGPRLPSPIPHWRLHLVLGAVHLLLHFKIDKWFLKWPHNMMLCT